MTAVLVVLDTNICLDLFVFHDPSCRELYEALNTQTISAVTREDCREEWLRVLDYPALSLCDSQKNRSKIEFDQTVHIVCCEKRDYRTLPVCSDKDDQKFMELAYDARANWLITRDKALLKLARKNKKNGYFDIIAPRQWTALPDSNTPNSSLHASYSWGRLLQPSFASKELN